MAIEARARARVRAQHSNRGGVKNRDGLPAPRQRRECVPINLVLRQTIVRAVRRHLLCQSFYESSSRSRKLPLSSPLEGFRSRAGKGSFSLWTFTFAEVLDVAEGRRRWSVFFVASCASEENTHVDFHGLRVFELHPGLARPAYPRYQPPAICKSTMCEAREAMRRRSRSRIAHPAGTGRIPGQEYLPQSKVAECFQGREDVGGLRQSRLIRRLKMWWWRAPGPGRMQFLLCDRSDRFCGKTFRKLRWFEAAAGCAITSSWGNRGIYSPCRMPRFRRRTARFESWGRTSYEPAARFSPVWGGREWALAGGFGSLAHFFHMSTARSSVSFRDEVRLA